jgi:uncharacterized protein (TIGR04255 family)
MKVPQKISPCPIVEALVELRFEPLLPEAAIFGVVFNAVKKEYPEAQALDILNLPLEIRNHDPNLTYKPTHKMQNGDNILQVGPRVITFSRVNKYNGWDTFSSDIKAITEKLIQLEIVKSLQGFSLRYINKFDFDIWDKLDLKVLLGGESLKSLLTHVRADIQDDEFVHLVQVANNVNVSVGGQKQTGKSSIIDITTALIGDMNAFDKRANEILEAAHTKEKNLYFRLLTDEYINELNPEYD